MLSLQCISYLYIHVQKFLDENECRAKNIVDIVFFLNFTIHRTVGELKRNFYSSVLGHPSPSVEGKRI